MCEVIEGVLLLDFGLIPALPISPLTSFMNYPHRKVALAHLCLYGAYSLAKVLEKSYS